MKKTLFAALLVVILTACALAPPTTDIQGTALAIVPTGVALTQTAMPTSTPPPPSITLINPTPTLARLFTPIVTPDTIQVERWKEYQTALAMSLLSEFPPEFILCEWVILGQSNQEVYVVAVCGSSGARSSRPAVIYLKTDGSIQNVESVAYGSTRRLNIQRLFPPDIQEIIYSGSTHMISEQLREHLDWRLSNREEPPLIVLSAIPTP